MAAADSWAYRQKLERTQVISKREAALQALYGVLQGIAGVDVKRNENRPTKIPATGLMILRDGEIEQVETILSPLRYLHQHRAEVEVLVQDPQQTDRDTLLDTLMQAVGNAVSVDNTLGSVVDIALSEPPEIIDEPVEGAAGIKAALVPIMLEYATDNPLT